MSSRGHLKKYFFLGVKIKRNSQNASTVSIRKNEICGMAIVQNDTFKMLATNMFDTKICGFQNESKPPVFKVNGALIFQSDQITYGSSQEKKYSMVFQNKWKLASVNVNSAAKDHQKQTTPSKLQAMHDNGVKKV